MIHLIGSFRPTLVLAIFAGLALCASHCCFAQAFTTAHKSAEITVFGGYLLLDPDDTAAGEQNTPGSAIPVVVTASGTSTVSGKQTVDNGGTIGANYTRYFHFPVAPSLEIRANAADGPVLNEKSYLVGVRAVGDLHRRFHPYVDFLIGKGTIHYNTTNPLYNNYGLLGDESAVFNYGAGLDYDIAHHFAAKVDLQAQRWRTGATTYYYPVGLLVGVTYRIPFRRYVADRDVH